MTLAVPHPVHLPAGRTPNRSLGKVKTSEDESSPIEERPHARASRAVSGRHDKHAPATTL